MKKHTSKSGFYTVEAALFLPLILLMVLSFGYYIKAIGQWENCVFCVTDECASAAAHGYTSVASLSLKSNINKRISADDCMPDSVSIESLLPRYSDIHRDKLTSVKINGYTKLNMPMGFSRDFNFKYRLKFRNFAGIKITDNPLGYDGLEADEISKPVWIFPQDGVRYHTKNCTFVLASVKTARLTTDLKSKYSACPTCNSGTVSLGSIVYYFSEYGNSYHRGSCSTIDKHTTVIDEQEAKARGYTPCSKCYA